MQLQLWRILSMKKAMVLALALLLAGTYAVANDTNGRDGSGGYGPFGDGYANLRSESDVLIYQCREANDGFGDLIPIYEAVLTGLGATVSTIDAPSGGGAFPADYDPGVYCTTFILTTENWWGPNFPPNDEATVAAYMEGGGGVYFSGQDYLYGAGYPDGDLSGMFPGMLGVGVVVQDTPFGADYMDVLGMNDYSWAYLFCDSFTIFLANPFYPDTINPREGAFEAFHQISPEDHPGGVYYDSGTHRAVFTALELSGDVLGVFPDVVAQAWDWLKFYCGPPVPVEESTLGQIKANYR
jgi:hypothetical protein